MPKTCKDVLAPSDGSQPRTREKFPCPSRFRIGFGNNRTRRIPGLESILDTVRHGFFLTSARNAAVQFCRKWGTDFRAAFPAVEHERLQATGNHDGAALVHHATFPRRAAADPERVNTASCCGHRVVRDLANSSNFPGCDLVRIHLEKPLKNLETRWLRQSCKCFNCGAFIHVLTSYPCDNASMTAAMAFV